MSFPVPLLAAVMAVFATAALAQDAPAGTGSWRAVMEADPGLPLHTVYRPGDLAAKGMGKLPIVAWANGACSENGASFKPFLTEIASHGYLIVALGSPGKAPDIQPPPTAPYTVLHPKADLAIPPPSTPQIDPTQPKQLTEAIDWAVAENARKGGKYAGKLDTAKIAVMGQSCGGLQALTVADDPRLTTVVIWNSGIYTRDQGRSGVVLKKDKLKTLHAPMAYFLGGPGDIAYPNGMDDFAHIDRVPVMAANLDVGHGGTYRQLNGGKFAVVGTAWLDWRLKGDAKAGAMFAGAKCGLCVNPEWTVQKKQMN
jgi:hypothetical protein